MNMQLLHHSWFKVTMATTPTDSSYTFHWIGNTNNYCADINLHTVSGEPHKQSFTPSITTDWSAIQALYKHWHHSLTITCVSMLRTRHRVLSSVLMRGDAGRRDSVGLHWYRACLSLVWHASPFFLPAALIAWGWAFIAAGRKEGLARQTGLQQMKTIMVKSRPPQSQCVGVYTRT